MVSELRFVNDVEGSGRSLTKDSPRSRQILDGPVTHDGLFPNRDLNTGRTRYEAGLPNPRRWVTSCDSTHRYFWLKLQNLILINTSVYFVHVFVLLMLGRISLSAGCPMRLC